MRIVSVLVLLALLSACSQSTEPEDDGLTDGLSIVGGNNQTDDPGEALPVALTVQVAQGGSAVSGQLVSWTVTAGGGTLSSSETTTGSNGRASVTWTLGPDAGTNRVEAAVPGVAGSPVVFTATGAATAPAPSVASVSVQDSRFSPADVRLAAGGTVTWTFSGSLVHNVTFSSGPNSGDQSSGTFARSFPSAGSYSYECTNHAQMAGKINVE